MARKAKQAGRASQRASTRPSVRGTSNPKTLPSPVELQQRFLLLQTGDVNNALEQLHEETQLLDLRVRPLRRGMKCAGVAVTWNAVLAAHDPFDRSDPEIKRWLRPTDHVVPGTVLVYQPGGEMSSGHLGSLYATMLHAAGASGAIVDGNLRDSDGQEQIAGWSAFARGCSPLEAASRIKWLEPNRPIHFSGELRRWITVHPGDMVIADGDGVIVVPQRLIVPVLDKAESIASAEINAQKAYASGRDPDEVEKEYGAA